MKKLAITTATVGALAAAAVGFAGAAAAVPTGSSAADTVKNLQDQGYNVQLNGTATGLLSRCTVTDVHGLAGTMRTTGEFDTVYVDVFCPPSNN